MNPYNSRNSFLDVQSWELPHADSWASSRLKSHQVDDFEFMACASDGVSGNAQSMLEHGIPHACNPFFFVGPSLGDDDGEQRLGCWADSFIGRDAQELSEQ